jgi:asparagine synthase (glutamine-hydrolysing)
MCGIVGFVGDDALRIADRMNSVQHHRGPDEGGLYGDDELRVALAMRRLAIIDVADGHQPMSSEDGRHVLVFNGEIFNAPRLRRELASITPFRTASSDSEALLHLLRLRGPAAVRELQGFFAFVLLDRQRRTLFGARDPLGIKPLYFHHEGRTFAFASELKALLVTGRPTPAVDLDAISHYLTLQFVPAPRSIFEGIEKLPAGHSFELDLTTGALRVERFWSLPPSTPAHAPYPTRAALRAQLERSVSDWLMSDVPIGFSLSGGVDSAAVVGLAAQAGIRPRTWTVGFDDDPETDERDLAKKVADRWRTEHTAVVLSAATLLDDLDRMVYHLDEPYAGGLPSWAVFGAMAGNVKVAITGTGGDELFGSYGKWRAHQLGSRLSFGLVRQRVRSARDLLALVQTPHGLLHAGYFTESQKRRLLCSTAPRASTYELLERRWRRTGERDPREAVLRVDLELQLAEEFLPMTDRFSMAFGIEARTPLLDRPLVELAARIPAAVRCGRPRLKQALIDAVSDLVPPELLNARKRGFVLPLRRWLRGRLAEPLREELAETRLRRQGLFDVAAVRRLLQQLTAGEPVEQLVWTLFMFQLWWRRFVDQGGR